MPLLRRLLGSVSDLPGAALSLGETAWSLGETTWSLGEATWTLGRSGLFGPYFPWELFGAVQGFRRWGVTLAAGYAVGSARGSSRVALVDDDGEATFAEMERDSSTIASALADLGIESGDDVAVLCRNDRGFVLSTVALGKLGADTVYLNTGFAGPQLEEVALREGAKALILDDEFSPLAKDLSASIPVVITDRPLAARAAGSGVAARAAGSGVAARAAGSGVAARAAGSEGVRVAGTFAEMLAAGPEEGPPAPGRVGGQTILTSGTTGTPKGARREMDGEGPLLAVLSVITRIPLRTNDTTLIAAPLFHAWGLANLGLSLLFGHRLVLSRRFDPEDVLAQIEKHRATVLVAVPVMLQRILDLPSEVIGRYDTSSLRVVSLSGSALPGDLATRFMDTFGDVIYNLYGSTEVGWVSIADPSDLRVAPGTAGRVTIGTDVKLLDSSGAEVPEGESGRIFVRSGVSFEGYTGGGGKELIDGYMSSGDIGHFDHAGRLFIDGRDDDMIVSGGENVFPSEIEDLLFTHPGIADVTVLGVDDEQFGQRLRAVVVKRTGAGAGDLTEEDVKAFVRGHLARYKIPRDVVFIDELPRTPTGKVLKRELR